MGNFCLPMVISYILSLFGLMSPTMTNLSGCSQFPGGFKSYNGCDQSKSPG